MQTYSKLMQLIRALARSRSGHSAVEFAYIAPAMLMFVLGIAFSQQIQVQQAAQAGAQYALLHGWNSTAISNAVTAATNLTGISAAPAPTESCGCPTGTTISAAACASACANGETAGTYVFVNAQSAYTPALPYSVLGSGVTLTAQATVRVQ